MKLVTDIEQQIVYISTGIKDLEGEEVIVTKADGFGGCDITVGCHTLRWDEFDVLKKAIELAEAEWRK